MEKAARILAVLSFAITAQTHAVPILQSTGGAVGSIDTNYILVDAAGNPTGLQSLVQDLDDTAPARTRLGDFWTGSSGEWISPFNPLTDSDNAWWSDSPPNTAGLFTYRTTILGTGSGLVTFDIASDNEVRIFVNDLNSVPFELMGGGVPFQNIETFALNLSAGDIVYFQVTNTADPSFPDGFHGNPSGLLVRGNSTSVPDGGTTAMLMGLALAGIGVVRRFLN
jgi:hypothetical protein